jgi:hypothetical protein
MCDCDCSSLIIQWIQGKPKNRKLPFFRLSICKIVHAGRVGQFPIFGYSLYYPYTISQLGEKFILLRYNANIIDLFNLFGIHMYIVYNG